MKDSISIIRENLSDAKRLDETSDLIKRAQLEEAALCLSSPEPEEAGRFFASAFERPLLSPEMLALCSILCRDKQEKAEKVSKTVKVACIRGPLSQRAIRRLCRSSDTVIITEEADFRSACDACAGGEADYCLLPMCSSQDGYYPTFFKLTKQNDLKICKTLYLSKPDSDEEICFALLSRVIEYGDGAKYCSFMFPEATPGSLSPLLHTLSASGAVPVSVISSPMEYNMDSSEHRIVVHMKGIRPEALLFFLEAALPGHTVLGIYESYK